VTDEKIMLRNSRRVKVKPKDIKYWIPWNIELTILTANAAKSILDAVINF
jgi:hypothetical protein